MTTPAEDRIHWTRAVPFLLVHLAAIAGIVWTGWSWTELLLAVALYYVRMFGVTAGYHRYFSHRSYKTSRVFQFLLAFLAETSVQKGALWWAANHRRHHKYSDQSEDVHSTKQRGFFWAHVGWILARRHEEVEWDRIPDLAKYPELRWLNRFYLVPPIVLGVALFAVGGVPALVWGFFVSTILLWHGTFLINSLTHTIGSRRYATDDDSRNSFVLSLLTLGEGWHNNHHHYQRSAAQGFFWWELDPTYYVLKGLELVGVVSDVHPPPTHALTASSKVSARSLPSAA